MGVASTRVPRSPPQLPLVDRVTFGAFADNEPWPSLAAHGALERLLGVALPTMSWFQSWDNDWLHRQARAAAGRPLLIAWQPRHDDGSPLTLSSIVKGEWDAHVRRFLEGAAGYTGEVTIRLAHEMNGNWYPWSGAPERYVQMWRHMVALGRSVAPKVRWMWCVNALDVGGTPAEDYWPGEAWVDLLGIDGYNGYGPWTSFGALFTPMHDRLRRLSGRPQWIAEVGSAEGAPGRKGRWLEGLFEERGLPAVQRVVFFHADKEHDWRLDSSPATLSVARRSLQRPARPSA